MCHCLPALNEASFHDSIRGADVLHPLRFSKTDGKGKREFSASPVIDWTRLLGDACLCVKCRFWRRGKGPYS